MSTAFGVPGPYTGPELSNAPWVTEAFDDWRPYTGPELSNAGWLPGVPHHRDAGGLDQATQFVIGGDRHLTGGRDLARRPWRRSY